MDGNEVVVKQSPFVFLKWIALAEFVLAVLPLFLAAVFDIQTRFENAVDARPLSYSLLLAVVQTLIQFLIVGVTFSLWQFPAYRIGFKEVVFARGGWFEDKTLASLASIQAIDVRQGWLGKRLDYGTLLIHNSRTDAPVRVRNIPNPARYADLILDRMAALPAPAALLQTKALPDLIAEGEGQGLEFKASLMWDYRRQSVNKELYEPVMKNLVGFMNTSGGRLLIGVGDEGALLGIEQDLSTLKKPNTDGFENVFNVAFSNMVGVENRQYVSLAFPQLDDKTICAITVQPSAQPVYLRYQGQEEFYIRAGNASQALPVSKAALYIQSRFTA